MRHSKVHDAGGVFTMGRLSSAHKNHAGGGKTRHQTILTLSPLAIIAIAMICFLSCGLDREELETLSSILILYRYVVYFFQGE